MLLRFRLSHPPPPSAKEPKPLNDQKEEVVVVVKKKDNNSMKVEGPSSSATTLSTTASWLLSNGKWVIAAVEGCPRTLLLLLLLLLLRRTLLPATTTIAGASPAMPMQMVHRRILEMWSPIVRLRESRSHREEWALFHFARNSKYTVKGWKTFRLPSLVWREGKWWDDHVIEPKSNRWRLLSVHCSLFYE